MQFTRCLLEYITRHYRYYVLIVAVATIANFLHFTAFGFYEDDWYYCASAFGKPANQIFAEMWHSILSFYLGRPVQEALLYFFSYIGAAYGSIQALYLITWTLYCLAAVLTYHVTRIRYPAIIAILTSLVFVLSPLTTIRQHLNGTLWSAPGWIFLCLAFLLYWLRQRWPSVILATLALLTYESYFFLYLAAPYIRAGRKTRGELIRHLVIWAGVLSVYIFMRHTLSERRIVSAIEGPPSVLALRMMEFDFFYTISSFKTYVYAIIVAARAWSGEGLLWAVLFFFPSFIALMRSRAANLLRKKPQGRLGSLRTRWYLKRVMAPALVLVSLGYALSYFHLGQQLTFQLSGRDTRVSLAAVFGSSLFVTGFYCLLVSLRSHMWYRAIINTGATTMVMALFLYSFVIQSDYVREWEKQRAFLTQMIMLSPDVTSDTLFVTEQPWISEVLVPGKLRSPSINSQPHGLQVSTLRLFSGEHVPQVFVVYSAAWKKQFTLRADGSVHWAQSSFDGGWGRDTEKPVGPIIALKEDLDGRVYREVEPVYAGERQISLLREESGSVSRASNWRGLKASPLVPLVLPGYAFTIVGSNALAR